MTQIYAAILCVALWLWLLPLLVWRYVRMSRWRVAWLLAAALFAALAVFYGVPVLLDCHHRAETGLPMWPLYQRESPISTFWAGGELGILLFMAESLTFVAVSLLLAWLGEKIAGRFAARKTPLEKRQ